MFLKRFIDIVFTFVGLIIFWWLILIVWFIATIETKSNGFFLQKRVGKDGKLFTLIKIKTMKHIMSLMDSLIEKWPQNHAPMKEKINFKHFK